MALHNSFSCTHFSMIVCTSFIDKIWTTCTCCNTHATNSIFVDDNSNTLVIVCMFVAGLCLEKRAFYRMVSGLHTSINTHLSARYFYPGKFASQGCQGRAQTDVVHGCAQTDVVYSWRIMFIVKASHTNSRHVNIGIIFLCIGNSQWYLYNTQSKYYWLLNS